MVRTRRPHPGKPSPAGPWLPAPRHGDPHCPVWLAPGRPLTQQQLPRSLLCGLAAAGLEVALGISDFEASLLPDGGGGGTWGKPKSPQVVASSVGEAMVGARAAEGVPECEGASRETNPPGSGGGGTSAASFFSLQGLKECGLRDQAQARGHLASLQRRRRGQLSPSPNAKARRGGRREGRRERKPRCPDHGLLPRPTHSPSD